MENDMKNRLKNEDEIIELPGDAVQLASHPVDLAQLGLNQIAYVRRAVIDNVPVWSIHSAAGHPIGAAPSFDQAWGAVMEHNLMPLRVN
jgi:hypothetical protein